MRSTPCWTSPVHRMLGLHTRMHVATAHPHEPQIKLCLTAHHVMTFDLLWIHPCAEIFEHLRKTSLSVFRKTTLLTEFFQCSWLQAKQWRLTWSLFPDWPRERSNALQLLSSCAVYWLCTSSSAFTFSSCDSTWNWGKVRQISAEGANPRSYKRLLYLSFRMKKN